MRVMQKKVLDHVKVGIEEVGLEAAEEPQWANTGKILAMSGDFDVEFTLSYDFQDDYCGFGLSGPAVDRFIDEQGVIERTVQPTIGDGRPFGKPIVYQYVPVADQEVRLEDCTGERGIALPSEMRKRYLKWYLVHYGEETRDFLCVIEDVAAWTVRS